MLRSDRRYGVVRVDPDPHPVRMLDDERRLVPVDDPDTVARVAAASRRADTARGADGTEWVAVVDLTAQAGSCVFMVRFLVVGPGVELANEIVSLFALSGTEAKVFGFYPGWAPNPSSPLLATCQAVYTEVFGGESETHVVHAGLECGLIGGKYPELDMVSFGPNIRGAHAPGESVDVASVERCWRLLRSILSTLTKPQ